MDSRYAERRREIDGRFATSELKDAEREVVLSPSGAFRLTLDYYSRGPDRWDYSRGRITSLQDDRLIADIKRNYGMFWHRWITHANGHEYLLCGEDYQGQTIVNLSTGVTRSHFPEAGYEGGGFCWAAVYPSPDSAILAVEGCYWACPYEVVFFDFSSPDELPYRELAREDDLGNCIGWLDSQTFHMTRALDVRKADGRPYNELTDAEQAQVDATPGALETIERVVQVDRSSFDRIA